MKLCPQCDNSPWPFVMVVFISGVITFLTWLTLGFAGANTVQAAIGALLAFLAVGTTLVHYILACMKRHCRHDRRRTTSGHEHAHHHGILR